MSETFTFANLTNTAAHGLSTKTGIVEPSRQFESTDRVLVARALVTNSDENRVLVRLLNVHNEVKSLRKGIFIAELSTGGRK
jgi:RNase P/RNase MRP subunit POP5